MSDRENRYCCYVVEGNTDRDRIKKLGAKLVVITGGNRIESATLKLISLTSKVRDIVILTDPDGPGKKIAARVSEACAPGTYTVVHTRFKDSIRDGKVGVAQMSTPDLKRAIEPYLKRDEKCGENLAIDASVLMRSGLVGPGSRGLKERLEERLGVRFYSIKGMVNCLNCLSIDIETLEGYTHE